MEASQLTESNLVTHGPCDSCGSSDALGVYDDGHSYCYSCSTYQPSSEGSTVPQVSPKETSQQKALLQGEVRSIKARGLTEETCRKFGYLVSQYNGEPVQVANYRDTKMASW
jgi:twinkle protein